MNLAVIASPTVILRAPQAKARTAYRRVTWNFECFGGDDPSDAIGLD
jgi:hypothetical protein